MGSTVTTKKETELRKRCLPNAPLQPREKKKSEKAQKTRRLQGKEQRCRGEIARERKKEEKKTAWKRLCKEKELREEKTRGKANSS